MRRVVKQGAVGILRTVARTTGPLADGMRRTWAHARLATLLEPAIDPSVVVLGTPEVHGTGRVRLGKNLLLFRETYFETQEDGFISVGDNVVLSRGVHLVAYGRIEIGADSMIGEYTSIRDANHRRIHGVPVRTSGYEVAPIVVGKNVWIGRGVMVLPGVTIGDDAVVGANAVVRHHVAPGSVVGGVPAQVLRSDRPQVSSRRA